MKDKKSRLESIRRIWKIKNWNGKSLRHPSKKNKKGPMVCLSNTLLCFPQNKFELIPLKHSVLQKSSFICNYFFLPLCCILIDEPNYLQCRNYFFVYSMAGKWHILLAQKQSKNLPLPKIISERTSVFKN